MDLSRKKKNSDYLIFLNLFIHFIFFISAMGIDPEIINIKKWNPSVFMALNISNLVICVLYSFTNQEIIKKEKLENIDDTITIWSEFLIFSFIPMTIIGLATWQKMQIPLFLNATLLCSNFIQISTQIVLLINCYKRQDYYQRLNITAKGNNKSVNFEILTFAFVLFLCLNIRINIETLGKTSNEKESKNKILDKFDEEKDSGRDLPENTAGKITNNTNAKSNLRKS